MKIEAIRIINYKGFEDSGFVKLDPKWNVVVGQNNSGKTAFIEGFRGSRNPDKPHRSLRHARDAAMNQLSAFEVSFIISRQWLKNGWLSRGGSFELPIGVSRGDMQMFPIDYRNFWDGPDLHPVIRFVTAGRGPSASSIWPSHRLFNLDGAPLYAMFSITETREVGEVQQPLGGNADALPAVIDSQFSSYVYTFEAKRFALGECLNEDNRILKPDASNLPAALLKLQANNDVFREFCENVHAIFPNIYSISVTSKGQNFEIRVWPIDPKTRRDDLSVPLNESGTGIGQVLAILYVAMTNDPGVIVIDEPNSFLHPGAAKKLIRILKRYDNHQYIISTHSPEVISAAQPAALHMVKFDGQQTQVETFDSSLIEAKRMMLEEVGASLGDMFSAERVVWVEGPTERECFESIISQELKDISVGIALVALRNTGDLDGKQADAALDIYDNLTQGGSILPVSTRFSFDSENKSTKKIEDLQRRCAQRARFLPRCMTENYLLSVNAIVALLHEFGEEKITAPEIDRLLQKHGPAALPKGSSATYGSPDFYVTVHGANLLTEVISEATETRYSYQKVAHSKKLLKFILENERHTVDELVQYVRELIT